MTETRSQSLAVGRLDGQGDVVILRPRDITTILEALRYTGEMSTENGGSAATERRLIDRIARLAHLSGDHWHIPPYDSRDWTQIVAEASQQ